MRRKTNFTCLLAVLLKLILVAPVPVAAAPAARGWPNAKPLVVRVAAISYDDYKKTFNTYQKILGDLIDVNAVRAGRRIIFRLAVGSYSDVLNWYTKDQVDLVMLTPEPVVELREVFGDDELNKLYVATHDTYYDHPARKFDYHATCVVSESSPIKDTHDLFEWARQGRLNFLFVHPLSASGCILPSHAFQQNGITIPFPAKPGDKNLVTWTYGSSGTIEELQKAHEEGLKLDDKTNERARVGFIYAMPVAGLRQIPFPGLDDVEIPQEIVLVNRNFIEHKTEMESFFDVQSKGSHFQKVPGWLSKFDEVRQWVREMRISSKDPFNQYITLDQLGTILRNFEMRAHKPPRVALVLSGGGAKCAYQLGAIEAIEDEISKTPATKDEKPVDLDLVVGTSGGAINALLVAMGLTRAGLGDETLNNKQTLEGMWEQFDTKDFFHPWAAVNVALGIGIGLFQAFVITGLWIIFLLFWAARRKREGRGSSDQDAGGERSKNFFRRPHHYPAFLLLICALFDVILYKLDWAPPWTHLGEFGMNHLWRHLWLILAINLGMSAITLIVIAAGMILWQEFRKPITRAEFHSLHRDLRFTFLFCLLSVLFLSLFFETTLSKSDGVERMLTDNITGLASIPKPGQSLKKDETLRRLSLTVESKLKRDLVITGSLLPIGAGSRQDQNDPSVPGDLYFFYDYRPGGEAAQDSDASRPLSNPPPPEVTDSRFRQFGGSLMDVVIGSSSIYPVFPYRALSGLNINIIDGGFVHNSPIDAAVSWKATHIILVESSPEVKLRESSLLENSQIAFNHLYTQAQLLDARARGKVEIFTLRPTASTSADQPDMCTFDFYPDMISMAIRKGFKDAASIQPHFRREPGEPDFADIGAEGADANR